MYKVAQERKSNKEMPEGPIARRIQINGIVQGVGFRPFVYRLALRYKLHGVVANTSSGVSIHLEGAQEDFDSFCRGLSQELPPMAMITEISIQPETMRHYGEFSIARSKNETAHSTIISPDISTCENCLSELFDPKDRRHHYPFINCTNCGPRYTIIEGIPYDRPSTAMKHFIMCPQCRDEYDDPSNRRFHAQPNACFACGPKVQLFSHEKREVKVSDPIAESASLLKRGYILAVKGLGGFHLAADAENHDAVRRLREKKRRAEKPFALMSRDVDAVRRFALLNAEEEALLVSPRRPILILPKKEPSTIAEAVSPRNRYFGVMLPYTPLHYLLLDGGFTALVMTSGNMSEEPIVIDNEEAFARLAVVADYFLIHNRAIYQRMDDSIVKQTGGSTGFIRRSRGYVPTPVFLRARIPNILACGGQLKNTVCLTKDNRAYLSQHIGDLEDLSTYEFFQMTVQHLKRLLAIDPEVIAYDLHPDYLSTRYALEQPDVRRFSVQHHHAHVVSCMAENGIDGPVIGLAFDGTGYGTDAKVWGGEILFADTTGFRRAAHLAYVPMPGGSAAIQEPWRMAVSYLFRAFGDEFLELDIPAIKRLDPKRLRVIREMISKRFNAPDTSSLGRLFDGVAALLGIRDRVSFEGQAAMELEMLAKEHVDEIYDYEWIPDDVFKIRCEPIIRGVASDILKGHDPSRISGIFHATLIRLFVDLCGVLSKENGLDRIVLSGGVFQNSILLNGMVKGLEGKGLRVYTHRQVPANDGGLSLGQAVIAASLSVC